VDLPDPPFSFPRTITSAEPDRLLLDLFQHVSTSTILAGTLWTISARRSVKRKAGGRYAADLVLQLPVRGPVPLHSAFNLIGNTWCLLTPLHAGMANPYQSTPATESAWIRLSLGLVTGTVR
jgi:hypothetical protein